MDDPTEMRQTKKGIIALIFKSGARDNPDNYRPITLLQEIYKIWAAVITNRISPIMNILTTDNQCAYCAKRSTSDAIFYIKRNFIKNKIAGRISFDLSKASGRIDRNSWRCALYGKGMTIKLIDVIIKWHTGKILSGKIDGMIGKEIENDRGVSQGVPISALYHIWWRNNGRIRKWNKTKYIKIMQLSVRNLETE